MTTVTITGTVKAAYELKLPVTTLSIAATGYVHGSKSYGVYTPTTANYGYVVLNSGRIAGGIDGVVLFHGGTVTNGAGGATGALIDAPTAVVIGGATGVVNNFATIQIHNPIAGANTAVALDQGGTMTNGSATDTTALLTSVAVPSTGSANGVITERAASTVTNFGTINMSAAAFGAGVVLQAGGLVTNGSVADKSALITAQHGVYVLGAAGSVANFGTIDGGAFILYGGGVTNGAGGDTTARITGTIGAYVSTSLPGPVSLTNFGTILGTIAQGVLGPAGVRVVNGSSTDTAALIEGAAAGVQVTGTLTNFGTIESTGTGSFSVKFSDAASTLFAESGSRFIGAADVGASVTDIVGGVATFSGGIISSGTVHGAGTMALTGGVSSLGATAWLSVAHIAVSGATTAVDIGGALVYAGVWTESAGVISVAAGDTLRFAGVGNSLAGTLAGAGAIVFGSGSDALNGVTVTTSHASITAASVTMTGTVTLGSSLSMVGSHVFVGASGAVLSGSGYLLLSNSTANIIQGVSASALLTNNAKITGAGQLGNGQMALTNGALGVVNGHYSNALVINVGTHTIANAGLIESTGAGGVKILSAISNTHWLLASLGTLSVAGAVTGAGTVYVEGGTADFASSFTENVIFTSASGSVLELAHSQSYTGRVSGFSKTGASAFDLLDIAFGAGTKASFSGTTASGVLTVTDGTHTAKITLLGNYTASSFTVSSDGHGGVKVVDPTSAPAGSSVALASAIAAFAPKASGPVWPTADFRRGDVLLTAPSRAHL